MDSEENVVPLCRQHHAEFHVLFGLAPAQLAFSMHRQAWLEKKVSWIAQYPKARQAMPHWLREEEKDV